MKLETVKKLIKATAIVEIVTSVVIVLNTILGIVGAVLAYNSIQSGNFESGFAVSHAITRPLAILVSLAGIAVIIMAALSLSKLKGKKLGIAAGVLAIVGGAFALLITFVTLILFILSSIFFLRIKWEKEEITEHETEKETESEAKEG